MDRPKKHRPKLYIVNLQWTPKDSAATCKLNGRCDDVMRRVMVCYLQFLGVQCGNVGGAGEWSHTCLLGTFLLCSLALSMLIYSNYQKNGASTETYEVF